MLLCLCKESCVHHSRFGTNVLVLERLVEVKDALKRMMLTKGWEDWKVRQQHTTRGKADELQDLIFATGPSSFWSRAGEAISLLSPALRMVRAMETDLPTSHIVYDLGSQVRLNI
jgi:hypothetical protein